jgi:hypothetical protein
MAAEAPASGRVTGEMGRGVRLRFEGFGLVLELAGQSVERVSYFPIDRDIGQVAASRSFFSQV